MRRLEIRARAIAEIRACCCIGPDCASIFSQSVAQADVAKRVSSVAGLAICARSDVPAFLQSLTNLVLGQMLLLCPVVIHISWLSVLGDERRRFHVLWFPIKVEDFLLGAQKILRVSMAFETPGHAVRFFYGYPRHLIHLTMTTEAADAAIDVG